MEYKITIENTWNGEPFVKTRSRIDNAIDDFWFFVEDFATSKCNDAIIRIYKNGVDITNKVICNEELKRKYYKGLGI